MRRTLGPILIGLLLAGLAIAKYQQTRPPTPPALAVASGGSSDFSYTTEADPYQAYFSGHWCNCWRKVDLTLEPNSYRFDGVLPRAMTPAASKNIVVHMTGMGPAEALLSEAAAGIIAKRQPLWYCTDTDDFWLQGARAPWKEAITGAPRIGHYGAVMEHQIGHTTSWTGEGAEATTMWAIKRWTNELDPPLVRGAVLYDEALLDPNARPQQPRELLNAVRMLAAVECALPMTPALYEAYGGAQGDSQGFEGNPPLEVLVDTRQLTQLNIANFGGDEAAAANAAITWALNTLKGRCRPEALAFMPPAAGAQVGLDDYLAMDPLFTFYVGGDTNLDERELELVLSQSRSNIPIVGVLTTKTGAEAKADEERLLRLFSRFSKYFVDAEGARALSIHSAMRNPEREPLTQETPAPPAYDADKVYVAFCVTTKNSVGKYVGLRGFHWDMAGRGAVPIGWAVPLAAADVAPNINKYYYQSATPNDCFIADLSGLGRIVPTVYGAVTADPSAELSTYLAATSQYMQYMGTSVLWTEQLDAKTQAQFAAELPNLQALVYGTEPAPDYLTKTSYAADGKPVFVNCLDLDQSRTALADLASILGQVQSGFAVVGVDEAQFGPEDDIAQAIAQAAGALGPRFVVVRPDQLPQLYHQGTQTKTVTNDPPQLVAKYRAAQAGLGLPRLAQMPKIDGDPSDWASAAKQVALTSSVGERPSSSDLGATVQLAYDANYLYVAARVRDDRVYADDVDPRIGDGLELVLDARRAPFREPQRTEGLYQLHLTPMAGLVPEAKVLLDYPTFDVGLVSVNKQGIEHQVASRPVEGGYVIEAAIPLLNFPRAKWEPGQKLGLGLAVNDLDEGARLEGRLQNAPGDYRTNYLRLAHAVLK